MDMNKVYEIINVARHEQRRVMNEENEKNFRDGDFYKFMEARGALTVLDVILEQLREAEHAYLLAMAPPTPVEDTDKE